jgi:phage terminase large subunit
MNSPLKINLPYNWSPRQYQKPVWKYLHAGGKRAVTRWHRRAGKDDLFLNWTCCAAHERKGNYWYMLPEYAQARKSMWDAVNPHTGIKRIDQSFPEAIRAGYNNQEMKIPLKCGSTFQLVGSDNFNSLVGSPPIGLVFSEYAISNPSAWAYLMPILEENGGWACFNSTPRGKNHFYKMCLMAEDRAGWYYDFLTADNTGIFTPQQLENIRAELHAQYGPEFGEALYQQEYFVSFDAAVMGAIWGDCIAKLEMLDRITTVPHREQYPVHCAYDLGRSDSTSIWFFQVVGQDIYVINHHDSNFKDVPFYCRLLRELADTEGYRYATQWIPHDGWAANLASGGKTVIQQFIDDNKDGKLGKFKRVPDVSVQDGIQAGRATFPRCWFDADKCEDGLEALKQYHYEYDEEKKTFSTNPVHDWSSHTADAWRYLSLSWKAAREDNAIPDIETQLKNNSIASVSMGKLTQQHLAQMRKRRENF